MKGKNNIRQIKSGKKMQNISKFPQDSIIEENKKQNNKNIHKNQHLSTSANKSSKQINKLNNKNIKTEPNQNLLNQHNIPVQRPRNNPFTQQKKKIEPTSQQSAQVQQPNLIQTEEKTEKIEFDSKTIKSFMPYFDKNMSYTKKLAKNEMKVIMLYDKKIDGLKNVYIFTEKYLFFIIELFKKISHPFYYVLSLTYLRDIKPYFYYFKNLASIFETFSDNLKSLGKSIKHSSNEEIENENLNGLLNVEFDLNNSVEKLNLIYADIFSIISNNLKDNVIDKPLFNKVESVEPKFWENLNKMAALIFKLEHRREKLMKKYKSECEPMFSYFKDKKQKQDPELFNELVCMKDFLFIEYDLISYCNKAFVKIRKFLKDIEDLYNDSTDLFCDYLEILKNMIKIYYDENRFIINPNILNSSMVANLEKLVGQDIRKNIEKKFSIKNIIEFSKNTNLRNEVNHLLLNYRDILIQSHIINDKNKTKFIEEITNFNLHSFKSTKYFFSFLQDLIPPILKFNYQNVIQLKLTVKRDAGLIKRWRNTILAVTFQGHILFLDETPDKNKESENNGTGNDNKINAEEKKVSNDIIVKDELSEGILKDKLIYMYLKTSYGIFGSGKKDDKYLFQIWSFYSGNKKNKQLDVDALSQDNLNKIINVLNDNNEMNLTQINK